MPVFTRGFSTTPGSQTSSDTTPGSSFFVTEPRVRECLTTLDMFHNFFPSDKTPGSSFIAHDRAERSEAAEARARAFQRAPREACPFTAIDTFYSRPAGSLGPKSFGLGHARRHPPSQTPPAIVRRGSSSRQFSPGSSADRFATPDPLPPTPPPSRILQPPIWILYVSHPHPCVACMYYVCLRVYFRVTAFVCSFRSRLQHFAAPYTIVVGCKPYNHVGQHHQFSRQFKGCAREPGNRPRRGLCACVVTLGALADRLDFKQLLLWVHFFRMIAGSGSTAKCFNAKFNPNFTIIVSWHPGRYSFLSCVWLVRDRRWAHLRPNLAALKTRSPTTG